MRLPISGLVCFLGILGILNLGASPSAHAGAPPEADPAPEAETENSATLDASISTDGQADADVGAESNTDTKAQRRRTWDARKNEPWIRRWRPESRLAEIGVYGGVFLINQLMDEVGFADGGREVQMKKRRAADPQPS